MAIAYQLWKFLLCFLDDGRLNEFLGTTIHGGLGRVLKRYACREGCPSSCFGCDFESTCLYSVLFESRRIADPYGANRPHPMTLRVPMNTPNWVESGSVLPFDILLVGRHCKDICHIIYAFEELGRVGLGSRRLKYIIDSVSSLTCNKEVYKRGDFLCETFPDPSILKPFNSARGGAFRINILSPLRLKMKSEFMMKLNAKLFISAIRTRYATLSREYGDGVEQEMCGDFGEVELIEDNTRWLDRFRHSGRTGYRRIEYGGLIGSFVIGNASPEAEFFIRAGEILQVGKGTAMGNGMYEAKPYNRISQLALSAEGAQAK